MDLHISEQIEAVTQEQQSDESATISDGSSATFKGFSDSESMKEEKEKQLSSTPEHSSIERQVGGSSSDSQEPPPCPPPSPQRNLETVLKENEMLRRDNALYRSRYDFIKDHLLLPYAAGKGELIPDDTKIENLACFIDPILRDAEELGKQRHLAEWLGNQLQFYIERSAKPCDDDEIYATHHALSKAIISLAQSMVGTCKLTPKNLDMNDFALLRGVSSEYWHNPKLVHYLVEAVIWSALIGFVFRSPFACWGESLRLLHTVSALVFRETNPNGWPVPTAQSEAWRVLTVEALLKKVERNVIMNGSQPEGMIDNPDEELTQSVMKARRKAIEILQGTLTQLFEVNFVEEERLWPIVDKAFEQSLVMSLQKRRMHFAIPRNGTLYDEREPILLVPESNYEPGAKVIFSVSPGIGIWGDGQGGELDKKGNVMPSEAYVENPAAARDRRIAREAEMQQATEKLQQEKARMEQNQLSGPGPEAGQTFSNQPFQDNSFSGHPFQALPPQDLGLLYHPLQGQPPLDQSFQRRLLQDQAFPGLAFPGQAFPEPVFPGPTLPCATSNITNLTAPGNWGEIDASDMNMNINMSMGMDISMSMGMDINMNMEMDMDFGQPWL